MVPGLRDRRLALVAGGATGKARLRGHQPQVLGLDSNLRKSWKEEIMLSRPRVSLSNF